MEKWIIVEGVVSTKDGNWCVEKVVVVEKRVVEKVARCSTTILLLLVVVGWMMMNWDFAVAVDGGLLLFVVCFFTRLDYLRRWAIVDLLVTTMTLGYSPRVGVRGGGRRGSNVVNTVDTTVVARTMKSTAVVAHDGKPSVSPRWLWIAYLFR